LTGPASATTAPAREQDAGMARFKEVSALVCRVIGRRDLPDDQIGRKAARVLIDHLVAPGIQRVEAIQFMVERAGWLTAQELNGLMIDATTEPRRWSDDEIRVHLNVVDRAGRPRVAAAAVIDRPAAKKPNLRSRKRFLKDGDVPEGVFRWADPKEKGARLYDWLKQVFAAFPGEARVPKVASILQNLWNFDKRRGGYSWVTNKKLAALTSTPVAKIELAMAKMATAGFIVRSHTFTREGLERRTWPAFPATREPAVLEGSRTKDEPAVLEGSRTRRIGKNEPANLGGEIRE